MKKRVNYLSLASVISSFAVVMLHTNGCFWAFSRERYWITANIIESVMSFAVPVFFMISGATLINYRERYTLRQYAEKRIQKTLIPFIIWSIIGVVYFIGNGAWELDLSVNGLKKIILSIINIDVINIYWFFGALFSVYLCIPLLGAVSKELRIRVFSYVIIISFVFNSLLPFISNVFDIDYVSKVIVPVGGEYIIYVLLGYVLHNVSFSKKQRIIIYIMSIAGLLMHIIGTQILSFEIGAIDSTFKGYLNIPCIMYSVGIYMLFKQIGEKIKNQKALDLLNKISSYTFAVYLLHWFVMDTLVREFQINTLSIMYRVGAPMLIYAICIGITWIVRKIPVVKHILP